MIEGMSILRRTAAEITAAAICELYPNVELWEGGETPSGFFYDFYVPHPTHLHLIEEKMKQIVREKRTIRTLEMVAFSAAELLKSRGHVVRAEKLGQGLVEMVQIGSFHDLSPGPHLKNTAELAAFKLSLESLPDQGTRILGWCHRSKKELRQLLKKLSCYREPSQLGEEMGLWKGSIWLPAGLKMREQLIQFLKRKWFSGALEISSPGEDRTPIHRSMQSSKVAEIWVSPARETHIQVSFFSCSDGEMISCLQLIGKTLTILGFNPIARSVGQQVDYLVEDELGASHSLVQVKRISKKRGSSMVDFCFTAVVERILSLSVGKNFAMVELENQ